MTKAQKCNIIGFPDTNVAISDAIRRKHTMTLFFLDVAKRLACWVIYYLSCDKMTFGQRHVAINIYNICEGHFGSGGQHLTTN